MELKVSTSFQYYAQSEIPLITLLKLRRDLLQTIHYESLVTSPQLAYQEYHDHFGNNCQRMVVPMGYFSIQTQAHIGLLQAPKAINFGETELVQNLPNDTLVYLLASRYCESDLLYQQSVAITQSYNLAVEKIEAIIVWVKSNIKYEYNHSSMNTSALDTIRQKHGVCRDLSHVCIALLRAINLPARYVVGYLYDLEPMDMHAWFEVYVDGQWQSFDASPNSDKNGRAILAYGRDAADVATATYFGDMQLITMDVHVDKIDL